MVQSNLIQFEGKYDEWPKILREINNNEKVFEEGFYRFGDLCSKMIELVKGKDLIYGINYIGDGPSNIYVFNEAEENVIYHLVSIHNNLVNMVRGDLD